MYLFKTLKSLSKYSKQLTRSSQQLNAVPHQTISENRNQYDTANRKTERNNQSK